jgi:cytochrome c5
LISSRSLMVGLLLAAGVFCALCASAGPAGQNRAKAGPSAAQADQPTGEQLFETHCVRCHRPPEELSPRTSKAVLRHMRVRATLSAEDEQKILKYLAP